MEKTYLIFFLGMVVGVILSLILPILLVKNWGVTIKIKYAWYIMSILFFIGIVLLIYLYTLKHA